MRNKIEKLLHLLNWEEHLENTTDEPDEVRAEFNRIQFAPIYYALCDSVLYPEI